ncbi:hypothetical protein C8R46DRAFT_1351021 [Mycena filopes]|nr:hypothetical protein C8R46DRAFT_1351021 [Mycena filopes]
MDSAPVPNLPPELERDIFELCALYYPQSIPKSKSKSEWMRPLLYRTLIFDHESYPIKEQTKAALPVHSVDRIAPLEETSHVSCFAAVRHLFLSSASDSAASTALLSACPNVENLSLFGVNAEWIPLISRLPLRHLYAPPPQIIGTFGPAFPHLTHIEIFESRPSSSWDNLVALPRLSHLSFHDSLPEVFLRLLRLCAHLRVLICMGMVDNADLAQDVRFVCTSCNHYVQDWYMGARWGEDYWHRAELFIAKRRAGEIRHYDAPDESLATLPLAA